MKSFKGTHLFPEFRTVSLGVALGLAAILAMAPALGNQEVAAIQASTPAPRSFTEATQPPTTLTTTLLVATNAEYWPMEYISDTQIVGHDIDLMNAIAAVMGVTVVYSNVQWSNILDGLIAGEFDAVISTLTVAPTREEVIDFTLPYVTFGDDGNIAIAVQQGDDVLRRQINEALRQLRADGTLETIIAAIAADVPDWQPRLPDWPYIFLPFVVRSLGQ